MAYTGMGSVALDSLLATQTYLCYRCFHVHCHTQQLNQSGGATIRWAIELYYQHTVV